MPFREHEQPIFVKRCQVRYGLLNNSRDDIIYRQAETAQSQTLMQWETRRPSAAALP
jgi:hypothetical protein